MTKTRGITRNQNSGKNRKNAGAFRMVKNQDAEALEYMTRSHMRSIPTKPEEIARLV